MKSMNSDIPTAELANTNKQLNVYYPLGSIRNAEYMRSYIIDNLNERNKTRLQRMQYEKLYEVYMKIVKRNHVSRGGVAGVMTCSHDAEYTNFSPNKYSGKIYIGGLGLEYNINRLLDNDRVTAIDIVERSDHIIELMSDRLLSDKRINITCGDPLRDIPRSDYNYMMWSAYQKWLFNIDGSALQQQYLRLKYSDENM